MNYQKVYNSLIKKAQSRTKPDCYTEEHHVVPRALGGSNDKSNLVYFTAREHCLAHLLLAKIHGDSMWHAANMMTNRFNLTSKAYAISKTKHAEIMSVKMSNRYDGKNHPQYGTKASLETRKKQSLAKKGKYSGANNPSFKGYILAIDVITGQQRKFAGNAELAAAGFQQQNVCHCLKGKRKTHKGHSFKRIAA